jgi:hypothetical protein
MGFGGHTLVADAGAARRRGGSLARTSARSASSAMTSARDRSSSEGNRASASAASGSSPPMLDQYRESGPADARITPRGDAGHLCALAADRNI